MWSPQKQITAGVFTTAYSPDAICDRLQAQLNRAILFQHKKEFRIYRLQIETVPIDSFQWSTQIQYYICKGNGVYSLLYPLPCRRSKFSIPQKATLYKIQVRPICLYGAQIVPIKNIHVLLNAPLFMRNANTHLESHIPFVKSFTYSVRFSVGTLQHDNNLIKFLPIHKLR
ncbi:uncharacterized protein LOC143204889 isoform X1 [Rhynchophorus ferrugineus]|uniref:uncharacterized protein LOC143204889 isoform X1 n=1 Tax=Rhynchophorus ferrugineus TaxID=354439 RepID=UPI003FCDE68D